MTATKKWFESKAIWGNIITLIPVLSLLLGIDLEKEGIEIYQSLMAIVGISLSIYGRVKSNTTIASRNLKEKF